MLLEGQGGVSVGDCLGVGGGVAGRWRGGGGWEERGESKWLPQGNGSQIADALKQESR